MLTTAQQTILAADINADPLFADAVAARDPWAIAAAYDAETSHVVWKSSVTQVEIMQNGFDWVQVDNLSVGKARIWEWMFASTGYINPSKPNVRAGIEECWKGTAAMLAVRNAVLAHCRRTASRVEKLLADGTGTNVSPATMSFQGSLSAQDVATAMGW